MTFPAAVLILGGLIYAGGCFAAFAGLMKRLRTTGDFRPHVDVIIAARNMESTVGDLLDDLTAQDYPPEKTTICVVDDHSEDGTSAVVASRMSRHPNIILRSTADSQSPYLYKKKAVHEGILSTSGEIVMTVDADCRVGRGWIGRTVGYFVPGIDLVAGEVNVVGKGFSAGLEILEFTGIQMMSAGLMNAGLPVTCNGANLAYRRSAFERVGGFDGYGRVVSGDDDLLMQKIARTHASAVVYATGGDRAARVEANDSLKAFLVQRTRWASKILSYPSKAAIGFLGLIFMFLVLIPLWIVFACAGMAPAFPLYAVLLLKLAGDALLVGYGVMRRGEAGRLLLFPLAEILHVPYILYVVFRGSFGTFHWHGRKVKAQV